MMMQQIQQPYLKSAIRRRRAGLDVQVRSRETINIRGNQRRFGGAERPGSLEV